MEIKYSRIDAGKAFDWGKTSEEYAKYRDIYPSEFYKKKLEQASLTKSPIVHIKNFLPKDTAYSIKGKRGNYIVYYGRLSYEKGIMTCISVALFKDSLILLTASLSLLMIILQILSSLNGCLILLKTLETASKVRGSKFS